MHLLPEWRQIVRYAWSIRLIALAVALSALEAAVPIYLPGLVPHGVLAIAAAVVTTLAGFSRLIAQRAISAIDFSGTEGVDDK